MTAQPATRRVQRAKVDPGPMPPRWHVRGDCYVHTSNATVLVTEISKTSWCFEGGATVAADVLDLLRWLERGGR